MKKIDISTKRNPSMFALVSNEDFNILNESKWRLNKSSGYVIKGSGTDRVFMHRIVNSTPDGLDTDHINRNKLDNTRKNLRTVTKMINGRNRGENKNNTSGYKGISWDKKSKKWAVYLWKNYKKIHLGRFINLSEAYRARKSGEGVYWV